MFTAAAAATAEENEASVDDQLVRY